MCNKWTRVFQIAGSDDPEGCSVQLLTLIWQGLCEPIWTLRNDILHRNPNPRVLAEMTSLADQLQWFQMAESTRTLRNNLKWTKLTPNIYTKPPISLQPRTRPSIQSQERPPSIRGSPHTRNEGSLQKTPS
jgi:hypothetical protein